MKKYNIALLPITKCPAFVEVSRKFSILKPIYNLGEKSLPHVTLCQFYRKESEIDSIWDEICIALNNHTLNLEFKNFSFITFDNMMFWISLMPSIFQEIHMLQVEAASILQVPSNRLYEPHLTLVSTLDSAYKVKAASLVEHYHPISDKFKLALGECDELGQFVRIIH